MFREVSALPNEMKKETKELPNEINSSKDMSNLPDEIGFDKTVKDLPNEVEKTSLKGGSYREIVKACEGGTHEVHHMPADSVSYVERNDGPAIKMEKADHRQTASCGNSREAREYRAKQKELIDQGKFREAIQMDIDDIHEKFGNKYDGAIKEMLKYVDKLEAEGKIHG